MRSGKLISGKVKVGEKVIILSKGETLSGKVRKINNKSFEVHISTNVLLNYGYGVRIPTGNK